MPYRLIRFSSVGILGSLVYIGTLNLLINKESFSPLNFFLANFFAFTIACLHNYLWHKHWTFRFPKGNQLIHFYEASLIGAGLNMTVTNILIQIPIETISYSWRVNLVAILGILVTASWNYLAYGKLVFITSRS